MYELLIFRFAVIRMTSLFDFMKLSNEVRCKFEENDNACDDDIGVQKMNVTVEPTGRLYPLLKHNHRSPHSLILKCMSNNNVKSYYIMPTHLNILSNIFNFTFKVCFSEKY